MQIRNHNHTLSVCSFAKQRFFSSRLVSASRYLRRRLAGYVPAANRLTDFLNKGQNDVWTRYIVLTSQWLHTVESLGCFSLSWNKRFRHSQQFWRLTFWRKNCKLVLHRYTLRSPEISCLVPNWCARCARYCNRELGKIASFMIIVPT